MSRPFVSFKAIKQAVTMTQVLAHYGLLESLKRHGADGLTGPCPIHQGTNTTQFRVSLGKNCWNCFGGCQGGNVLDFVMAMERLEIRQAALLLMEWFDLNPGETGGRTEPAASRARSVPTSVPSATPTPPPPAHAAERAVPTPPKAPTPAPSDETGENPPLRFAGLKGLDPAPACLVKQGFSPKTLEAFGAGLCGKGIMRGRIAIPIHNAHGALVAYAGLSPEAKVTDGERYKYPPGFHREWEVFNLHQAGDGLPHLVTEDCLDVLRLHEAGYPQAVALMGLTLSLVQGRLLLAAWGQGAPVVVLMPPVAEAGLVVVELAHGFSVRYRPCRPQTLGVEALKALLEDKE